MQKLSNYITYYSVGMLTVETYSITFANMNHDRARQNPAIFFKGTHARDL
jgi:hypothetical protein